MEKKAVLCPECRKLISGYVDKCPHCGLKNPVGKGKFLNLIGGNSHSFTKAIIIINVVIFAITMLVSILFSSTSPMGKDMLGLLPSPSILSFEILGWARIGRIRTGEWWTLISAMFLHGGLIHILFNMLWVRDLAPVTEKLFSPHKMLIIYILSGIVGNLVAVYTPLVANTLIGTQMNSHPVVGASGAVFGLMGAIIAFGKKRGGFFGRELVRQLGMWAAILIFMGFVIPRVSNAAHIGGFVSGFLIGLVLPTRDKSFSNLFYIILGTGIILLCGYSFVRMLNRLIAIISQ